MVVLDGLLRSGRGNGATVEVFLFCFFFFFFSWGWIVRLLGLIVGAMVLWVFFCYYGLWLWPMVVQTQATRLVACVEL